MRPSRRTSDHRPRQNGRIPEPDQLLMQALVWLPVDNASLDAVQALLRQRDVFTTGYEHVGVDAYNPATYLHDQLLEETSFGFRYDRNVLSRMVEVVQGKPLSEEHRVACGIQVLAQITEAVVEPNTALYELGSGCSHADAEEQLALFRRIDHTHPQHWADLATGRADRLTGEQLADWKGKSIKENDYSKRLNRWSASYAVCLKIASLELSEMGAELKMLELVRWMEEDLCFLLPGVILANRFLAPNSCRAGLFKQLRSPDRRKALKGIRNQAWDLTLIYAWMEDCRNIATTGKIVVLASLDRGLHSIARSVLMATEAEHDEAFTKKMTIEQEFLSAWGMARGRRLLDAWQAAQSRRQSHPERKRVLTLEDTRKIEQFLEADILLPVTPRPQTASAGAPC